MSLLDPTAKAGAPATPAQGASTAAAPAAPNPATSGAPNARSLKASLDAHDAKPKEAPTGADDGKKTQGAEPRGAPAEKKNEGETADAQAGKPEEGKDEKEPASLPPWMQKRIQRERSKAEKATTELRSAQGKLKDTESLLEIALAENERLQQAFAKGERFDEKDEEVRQLQLEKQLKETREKNAKEQAEERRKAQAAERRGELVKQITAEIDAAVAKFPLVSFVEVHALLTKNPKATAAQVAQELHEKRRAEAMKGDGGTTVDRSQLPTTVDKSTGRGGFQHPANARGIRAFLGAADAKG